MGALPPLLYSVADYLEFEKTSDYKHEYHDGEIFAVASGTPKHSQIATNAVSELRSIMRKRPCNVYNGDLQVAISESKYVYPDATVICKPMQFYEDNPIAAKNPLLIVEVLSESTESYDRGGKFLRYRLTIRWSNP